MSQIFCAENRFQGNIPKLSIFMNTFLSSILLFTTYNLTRLYAWLVPIKKNRFVFFSMGGNNYGDSVKCLSDYVQQQHQDAEIVWAFSGYYYDKVECEHKKVVYGSFRYYYYVISSKYYVSNCYAPLMAIKRKGQVMLQTWHGTALKRLGHDVRGGDHSRLVSLIRPNTYKAAVRDFDYFISGSRFMTEVYHRALEYPKKIDEIGMPRNDVFFQENPELTKKVRQWIRVGENVRLMLYTPTFRPDFSFTYYDVDLSAIKAYFEKKTNEKYAVLIRLHPRMMSKAAEIDAFWGKGNVYNVTLYPDILDLLYAADVLVTDYSSTMFDFMLTMKPVILYTPDKATYNRGFYFDIDDLPFMVANSNAELIDVLETFDEGEYRRKMSSFLERIGNAETGHATEKAYQLLVEGRTEEMI